VQIVLKSGSLSLLEPSGPVQGCNGIDLTFTYKSEIVALSGKTKVMDPRYSETSKIEVLSYVESSSHKYRKYICVAVTFVPPSPKRTLVKVILNC
jgi:hypothetical protein